MNLVIKQNNIIKTIIFCLLFSITTITIFSNVVIPINNTYAAKEEGIDKEPGMFEEGILRAVAHASEGWLTMTSKMLGGVGVMLNKVVEISIIKMATYTNNPAVTNSWGIIRDLLNIFFIFGLLYISIKTIISSWSSDTKRLLSRLIVAAILINFSFFFTSLLIDVSNVVSLNVYKGMSTDCYNYKTRTSTLANCWLDQMKTNTVYKVSSEGSGDKADSIFDNKKATKGDWKNFITVTFAGGFVFIFASIIFFAITIALLARFVSLIFILITSPVMFASWILPNFSDITRKWTTKLQSELIFAPAVFIFMYISYNMLGVVATYGNNAGFASAIKTSSSSMNGPLGIFLNFIIIIAFMVGSLIAAKTVGNSVAGSGANFAGKLIGKAGNKVFGGTMRNTIGRGATRAADNIKGTGRISSRFKSTLNKVGNASFDARNLSAFQGVASKTGITFGQGQKGGFRDAQSSRIKAAKTRYENAGKLTAKEQKQRDELKQKLAKDRDTEFKKIEQAKKDLKVFEEKKKILKKNSPEYKTNESMIRQRNVVINNNTKIIKNDNSSKSIKGLEDKAKDRQKAILEQLTKQTSDKMNRFVQMAKKANIIETSGERDAAREIRIDNEKKSNQSEIDKIIKGVTSGVNKSS